MFKSVWHNKAIFLTMIFFMVWTSVVHAVQTSDMQIAQLQWIQTQQSAQHTQWADCHSVMMQHQQHQAMMNDAVHTVSTSKSQDCHTALKTLAHDQKMVCQDCTTLHCSLSYSAVLPADFMLNQQDKTLITKQIFPHYQAFLPQNHPQSILRPPKA